MQQHLPSLAEGPQASRRELLGNNHSTPHKNRGLRISTRKSLVANLDLPEAPAKEAK